MSGPHEAMADLLQMIKDLGVRFGNLSKILLWSSLLRSRFLNQQQVAAVGFLIPLRWLRLAFVLSNPCVDRVAYETLDGHEYEATRKRQFTPSLLAQSSDPFPAF